jgi:hypothetical protein
MRTRILALLGLLVLVLPQAAHAQPAQTTKLNAQLQYAAKFICGFAPSRQGVGVVTGHYNTVINVTAVERRTSLTFRATALSTNLEVDEGVPSPFYLIGQFDADEGGSINCGQIKSLLGVGGPDNEGFIEGFVSIYSDRPLNVNSVLTGQDYYQESGVSVLETIQVPGNKSPMKIQQVEAVN